jgi:hypothetical protein
MNKIADTALRTDPLRYVRVLGDVCIKFFRRMDSAQITMRREIPGVATDHPSLGIT